MNQGRLTPIATRCIRHLVAHVSDLTIDGPHLLQERSHGLQPETNKLSLTSCADRIHPHTDCSELLPSAVVSLLVSTPSPKRTILFRMGRHMIRVLSF